MSIDDFVDHLYTYLYVYMVVSGIMARLYWRIKQAGRWTWVAARDSNTLVVPGITKVESLMYRKEEEE